MGVVIEICVKYPGDPTRMTVADIYAVYTAYTYTVYESSYRIMGGNLGGGEGGATDWYISVFHSSSTPGVFYTCSYNHAHRLRLEKLL